MLAALLAVGAGCRGRAPADNTDSSANPATAGNGVEIEFWHTQTMANAQALDELVKRFNEAHQGRYRVKALYQGSYNDLYRKTMAAIAAGRPPDCAVAYEGQVAEYMKANVVQPLDEYLAGSEGLDEASLADIFPTYLASNRFAEFDNQLLSFPFTKSVLVLYYNEKALRDAGFDGPPRTWDEFRQAALKTTTRDASGKTTRYGFAVWADASTIDGCILARGGELLSADRRTVRFNEEPGREVYRLVADLVKQGAALRTNRQQYPADFGSGRVAMFLGSSTAREVVAPAVAGKFPWGITVIPQQNADKPVTVQYGANVAVFKTTPEKQQAAWAFLRWLAEPEQTTYWATHSTYMPLRASVASRPEMEQFWQKDPQAKQCFEVAEYGVTEPNVRGWQDARTALEEAYEATAAGTLTPEKALAQAEAKANAALAEKR